MEEENKQIEERKKKIEELRKLGIDPFPHKYQPTHNSSELNDKIEEKVKVAGRMIFSRIMGGSTFIDLYDQSGKIQLFLNKRELGDKNYKIFREYIQRGDIVGAEGKLFRTKTNELTVNVEDISLLTKSIRPLPNKWQGIKDTELIYRQRSLDLMLNPDSRERFQKRSKAISIMREILEKHDYMEVEIPTLQPVYGGAAAKPFKTHLNAHNMEVYLSISPELYLKRLIVGGYFDGVYTICKNFRNEGIDRTHNPEFTTMECYKAFWDYNDMMKMTEEMWHEIFERINGTTKIIYGEENKELGKHEIDFKAPWDRRPMLELVEEYTGLNVSKMNQDDIRLAIQEPFKDNKPYLKGGYYQDWSWGELIQELFEKYVEDNLIQPMFVIDHPKETTPLCKWHRQDKRLIERFEPFAYGMELANAYSELNDPILQRGLFEQQGGEIDEPFCRAIEYGMPPTSGLGIGIDRMVMLLTESYSIRDVIFFPFMKQEQ